MGAIIIKADNDSNRIIKELTERLGAEVTQVNEEQYDDIMLGAMMDAEKTGILVTRESIFKKLSGK